MSAPRWCSATMAWRVGPKSRSQGRWHSAISNGYRSATPGSATASNRIAPWASCAATSHSPRMAATASNNRPALDVSGELNPDWIICRIMGALSQAPALLPSRARVRSHNPSVHNTLAAIRQGSSMALVAAGQRVGFEMRDALKAAAVGHQNLAAPDRAVHAVTGAVERHADDGLMQTMFGHDAGDVRVMMLNADLDGGMGRPDGRISWTDTRDADRGRRLRVRRASASARRRSRVQN